MPLKRTFIFIFFIVLGLHFCLSQNASFKGEIVAIKDGDTFKVLHNNQEITIRLAHIDCPEKKQPFGNKAKQYASMLCFRKNVTVRPQGKKDRNGRVIAEIFVDNICINKELVKKGLAWHFKKYSKNLEYANLEITARKQKKEFGLNTILLHHGVGEKEFGFKFIRLYYLLKNKRL